MSSAVPNTFRLTCDTVCDGHTNANKLQLTGDKIKVRICLLICNQFRFVRCEFSKLGYLRLDFR